MIVSQTLSHVYIFPLPYMSSTLYLQLCCTAVVLFNTVLYNKEQWEASKTNKGNNSHKRVQEPNGLLTRQYTLHNTQTHIIYSLQLVK